MPDLTWLIDLPADDPVFAPLRRAQVMGVAEYLPASTPIPADKWLLARAYRQAVNDAAVGRDIVWLASVKKAEARHLGQPEDPGQAELWHRQAVAALGYDLAVTAVHVAVRERAGQLAPEGVA